MENDRPIFMFVSKKNGKLYHFIVPKIGQEDFQAQFDYVDRNGWYRTDNNGKSFFVFQRLVETDTDSRSFEKTVAAIFERYNEIDI